MSASREKKQRKENPDAVLTQRQRKLQQEQQAAKRKTTLYTVIGVVIAIAVVALLVWHSGILTKGKPAATVNGQTYTAEDVNFYYQNALNQEYNMYAQYAMFGIEMPFDLSKPLGEQIQDEASGKTWKQYFQDAALQNLTRVTALCNAASADGYTMSEDGQEVVDATMDAISNAAAQNGMDTATYLARAYQMSTKAFRRNLEQSTLAADYQQSHLDALTYDDAALDAYYQENSADLDSFTFRSLFIDGTAADPVDADGNPLTDAEGKPVTATEEEQKAAKDAAKEKADTFAHVIETAADPEQAFIASAPSYVAESSKENYVTDPNYSLSSDVVGVNVSTASYGEWLRSADRKSGDVTVSESGSGYYVVLFLDRRLVTDPTANYSDLMIAAALAEADDPTTADIDESKVPTEAALSDAKKAADDLLAACTAEGKDFATLTYGKAMVQEHVYTQKGSASGAVNDWLFAADRKDGDTAVLADANGARLVHFDGVEGPYWKYTATNALKSADLTKWIDGLTADYKAEPGETLDQVGF